MKITDVRNQNREPRQVGVLGARYGLGPVSENNGVPYFGGPYNKDPTI